MKILFVDDEPMILNSLKRGLKKLDYDFYFISSGQAALELMKTTPINIVFSDMRMPKMSGLELLKIVDKEYPDVVKCILSGYAQMPQLVATINQASIFKYIGKPWDLKNELIPIIEECVDYARFKINEKETKEKLISINTAYQNIFKTYKNKEATKDQSYDIFKIFQHVFTKSMHEMLTNLKTPLEEELNFIDSYKVFMDTFIESVQKKEIYFEPKRIIDDVGFELTKRHYQIHFDTNEDINKDLFEGRGLHIKPALIALIGQLVDPNCIGGIQTDVRKECVDQSHCIVSYDFTASKRVFSNYKKLGHMLLFYKSIMKIFGGDLLIQIQVDKVNLIMKALLSHESEKDELDEDINR